MPGSSIHLKYMIMIPLSDISKSYESAARSVFKRVHIPGEKDYHHWCTYNSHIENQILLCVKCCFFFISNSSHYGYVFMLSVITILEIRNKFNTRLGTDKKWPPNSCLCTCSITRTLVKYLFDFFSISNLEAFVYLYEVLFKEGTHSRCFFYCKALLVFCAVNYLSLWSF